MAVGGEVLDGVVAVPLVCGQGGVRGCGHRSSVSYRARQSGFSDGDDGDGCLGLGGSGSGIG